LGLRYGGRFIGSAILQKVKAGTLLGTFAVGAMFS